MEISAQKGCYARVLLKSKIIHSSVLLLTVAKRSNRTDWIITIANTQIVAVISSIQMSAFNVQRTHSKVSHSQRTTGQCFTRQKGTIRMESSSMNCLLQNRIFNIEILKLASRLFFLSFSSRTKWRNDSHCNLLIDFAIDANASDGKHENRFTKFIFRISPRSRWKFNSTAGAYAIDWLIKMFPFQYGERLCLRVRGGGWW